MHIRSLMGDMLSAQRTFPFSLEQQYQLMVQNMDGDVLSCYPVCPFYQYRPFRGATLRGPPKSAAQCRSYFSGILARSDQKRRNTPEEKGRAPILMVWQWETLAGTYQTARADPSQQRCFL